MSEGTPKSQTKIVVPDGSPARPQAGTHNRMSPDSPLIPFPLRFEADSQRDISVRAKYTQSFRVIVHKNANLNQRL